MQIQELIDEYRKKTDEELLRLGRDRDQLTPEAIATLTDELARIGAERLKAFSKEEERQGRKEAFRLKRRRACAASRWWSRIQLAAAYAIGLLIYHFLPFKIPRQWEDAAIVGKGVTVSRTPPESEPGYTVSTFADAMQKQYIDEYRKKYPCSISAASRLPNSRNSPRLQDTPTATTTSTISSTRLETE